MKSGNETKFTLDMEYLLCMDSLHFIEDDYHFGVKMSKLNCLMCMEDVVHWLIMHRCAVNLTLINWQAQQFVHSVNYV